MEEMVNQSKGMAIASMVLGIVGPVSYTHLDVYKRQEYRQYRWSKRQFPERLIGRFQRPSFRRWPSPRRFHVHGQILRQQGRLLPGSRGGSCGLQGVHRGGRGHALRNLLQIIFQHRAAGRHHALSLIHILFPSERSVGTKRLVAHRLLRKLWYWTPRRTNSWKNLENNCLTWGGYP